jgi:hypothetical protein
MGSQAPCSTESTSHLLPFGCADSWSDRSAGVGSDETLTLGQFSRPRVQKSLLDFIARATWNRAGRSAFNPVHDESEWRQNLAMNLPPGAKSVLEIVHRKTAGSGRRL